MSQSISIRRRVHWMDTDAAGIWHHSTIIRWTEDAEAELHRRLGIIEETFGATPRVNLEYSFSRPLAFDDEVDVTLGITGLGDTSITYGITVALDGDTVATGRMTAVLIDPESGKRRSWPSHLRDALT